MSVGPKVQVDSCSSQQAQPGPMCLRGESEWSKVERWLGFKSLSSGSAKFDQLFLSLKMKKRKVVVG